MDVPKLVLIYLPEISFQKASCEEIIIVMEIQFVLPNILHFLKQISCC